jgi:hypothetical protein
MGIWTVVNRYFRSLLVWIPLRVLVLHAEWLRPHIEEYWDRIAVPFPGGWLIGSVMLVNLLAAHFIHFKLTWRRSGILLIHFGLVLMMLGELITGLYAIEGHMQIRVGRSANYVLHSHYPEIAILTSAKQAGKDDVVTVPRDYLKTGRQVTSELLPFNLEIVQFMTNASVVEILQKDFKNPATRGIGQELQAIERPEASGVDAEKVDMPAAYVAVKDRSGNDLGTFLLSVDWFDPQTVTVDGKEYDLYLRFKRSYRDYAIRLDQFIHSKFVGTNTPKDFRSKVSVFEGERDKAAFNTDIYMNHPLRYRGETFYQASFLPGDQGTVLQVVRNPGWLLPYISCVVVGVGMLVHFGLHLGRFIKTRKMS